MFLRISDPINQENPRYIENAHDDGIRSVSFNSVTNMLASGSSDNTVKLWKTNDISMCQSDINKCLYATLRFHQDSVNIVLFNEKTNVLASGADDNYICIWNVKDMKYQSLYDHSGPVLSLAFNEQTNVLASGSSDKTIKLWNLNFDMLNLRPFRTLSHSGPVISLSFNQNRNTLASCTSTEIKEWIASTDNHMLVSGAYSSLTSIAYNVNTNVLYRAENGLFFVILPTNNFIVKTENKIEW